MFNIAHVMGICLGTLYAYNLCVKRAASLTTLNSPFKILPLIKEGLSS